MHWPTDSDPTRFSNTEWSDRAKKKTVFGRKSQSIKSAMMSSYCNATRTDDVTYFGAFEILDMFSTGFRILFRGPLTVVVS